MNANDEPEPTTQPPTQMSEAATAVENAILDADDCDPTSQELVPEDQAPAYKIGLFSEKEAKRHGTVFFLDPDGNEVEVTAVMDHDKVDEYKWDDKQIVGCVTIYLRTGREGVETTKADEYKMLMSEGKLK